ncbi:F-box/kelch-repeat protein At1g80440-like [Macadamia integrifolia]|uniref:F-box/kelch-repeat protein At1g80440-like n=1 Tax=Macadamia integrifolia TaxID=60698 RepID=UPI001C500AF0|nr:F-box/kelch-repeat protein At1g80440-like [Macadamia integrifolia]
MEMIPCLPDEIARECLIRVPYRGFSTVSAVCRGWKEEIESLQFQQQRKASGLTRPIVVLTQAHFTGNSGGATKYSIPPSYRLTVYEPVTGIWAELPPVPGFSDGLPLFCQVAGVGLKLVVVGGWNPENWAVSKAVLVYDFVSATWHRGADMPGVPRSFFACASDSDRMVFVAGGHDDGKNALRSAMVYDVAKDEWVPLPDMAQQRDECKGIFHAGKFHVIGGYRTDMQGRFEKSAEAFDVSTWQWNQVQEDMLEAGTCPRTCVADDVGKIYRCWNGQVAVLEESGSWKAVAELPSDVRVGPCLVTWQGKLLVIGSATHGGFHMSYVLDLHCYKWTRVEAPEEYTGHAQAGCCLEI